MLLENQELKKQNHFRQVIQSIPFAYAQHRIILDEIGKPCDYEFLDVNTAYEKKVRMKASELVNCKATEVFPDFKKEKFDWIGSYGEIALGGVERIFEQYDESLGKWYRVHVFSTEMMTFTTTYVDITEERLLFSASEKIVQYTTDTIDYQEIVDTMQQISGAAYVALNKFEKNCRDFTTVALSGLPNQFHKASNILGFQIAGKKWKHDPVREEKIRDAKTTTFSNLHELTSSVFHEDISRMIEHTFRIGECAIVKTTRNDDFNGDFTLMFEKGRKLKNHAYVEAYADMVNMLFSRINAEVEVKESEDKYRSLVENLNEIIYILNENAEITYVSPNIKEISGYSASEVLGKRFIELVHPENKQESLERFKKAFSGATRASENRFIAKDGRIVWVRTSARPVVKGGRKVGIQGVLTDITERKEAEEKIRKLSQAVEQSPDSIIITDLNGNIEYLNPRFSDLSGYSYEEVIGKNPRILKSGKTNQETYKDLWKTITSGKNWCGEILNKRKNGELYWDYASISPIKNDKGDITHFLAIQEDITEQKENERLLQNNLREKEVLLSEVHHRVKNNMAVISSLISLQTELTDRNENPAILLMETQNRIKAMAMVHELVYENENFAEINIGKLLHRLVSYLEQIYKQVEKNIPVFIQAEDAMFDMNISIPLSLLVNEIISNTYKHAFPNLQNGQIEVLLEENKNGYLLVVQDNGIGIQNLEQLKNPESFGYIIIHGLVEQIRGKLTFKTTGKGLRVEVWFPSQRVLN